MSVEQRIREILDEELKPTYLEVVNDSARHHGHAGDDGSGESHFTLEIASPAFDGQSRVACHRIVYSLLQKELDAGLHALSIKIRT